MFYGASASGVAAVTLSSEVRLLGNSLLNPVNNSTVALTIPAGTKRVTFAYPKTLGLVESIKEGTFQSDVKGSFGNPTEINVEGANSYAAIVYYVYTFIPPSPFAQSNIYTIKI